MTTNVLILCTHNSARSVLAEAMLNHHAVRMGRDLRAHSAGSAQIMRHGPPSAPRISRNFLRRTCGSNIIGGGQSGVMMYYI